MSITFGKKIRDLRIARNLTQAQVAEGIILPNDKKISASTIGMLEQGRRKPSFEVLEAFADFFNVDLNTLSTVSTPHLNPRDLRQIATDLEKMMNELSSDSFAAHGGTVEDEADKELLKSALKTAMEIAKSQAKKKFTPKSKR